MILNEKVVNYKVADLFESYNFCWDHFSIQGHLKNSKINFKLFVVMLRYENRHYKYIFTDYFSYTSDKKELLISHNHMHEVIIATNLSI